MQSSCKYIATLAVLSVSSLATAAHAATICTPNYVCTTTIAANPNAATSNFQSPGANATVGYTIVTSDTNGFFNVTLNSMDPNALAFTNLYFDTIASTPNTGSNLGFSFSPTSGIAFDPNTSQSYSLMGTGVTSAFTQGVGGITDIINIPNSFFLTNPDNMPFTPTPPGTLVSLHLSQSFGYSVVGGSANFPAPAELGDAPVGAAAVVTPEPSSFLLLGTGMLALAGLSVKKSFA